MRYIQGIEERLMTPISEQLVKMRIIKDGKKILRKEDKPFGGLECRSSGTPSIFIRRDTMKKVGKRKSKRTKKQPKCTLCNPFRWLGNTKGRHRHSYYRQQTAA